MNGGEGVFKRGVSRADMVMPFPLLRFDVYSVDLTYRCPSPFRGDYSRSIF